MHDLHSTGSAKHQDALSVRKSEVAASDLSDLKSDSRINAATLAAAALTPTTIRDLVVITLTPTSAIDGQTNAPLPPGGSHQMPAWSVCVLTSFATAVTSAILLWFGLRLCRRSRNRQHHGPQPALGAITGPFPRSSAPWPERLFGPPARQIQLSGRLSASPSPDKAVCYGTALGSPRTDEGPLTPEILYDALPRTTPLTTRHSRPHSPSPFPLIQRPVSAVELAYILPNINVDEPDAPQPPKIDRPALSMLSYYSHDVPR